VRAGAAGPVFVDERGGEPPSFLRVGFPSNTVVHASPELGWVSTDVLITSGCLITRACLEDVGCMRDDLFIDNVDLEWGFRARAAGWQLIGVPAALLHHSIGDARDEAPQWVRLLTGRHSVLRYSAIRHYFITRNRVLLYWMPHVPWRWKLQDALRLPVKCVLVALATPAGRRAPVLQAMVHGFFDGLRRVAGPKPER
jgi:rhamnosyltransferase